MRTIAALLERRAAVVSLRRAIPRGSARLTTARSPRHLHSILTGTLVDAVVIGPEGARGQVITALRRDYPTIPLLVMMPIRSDDAELVLSAHRHRVAALVVEGLDEPILAGMLGRHGATARRVEDLGPLAGRLNLTDPLQQAAWAVIVAEAPYGLDTATLARRLAVARETLSRRFAAGSAPPLKRAIDAVRLVAAAQLLGSPAYRVEDAARLLGFSSASLLQKTARRTLGVAAREVATLDGPRIAERLAPAANTRWT